MVIAITIVTICTPLHEFCQCYHGNLFLMDQTSFLLVSPSFCSLTNQKLSFVETWHRNRWTPERSANPCRFHADPDSRVREHTHLVVVVTQGSAQLVVVHAGFVLASTPQLGHLLGLQQLELAVLIGPADELFVSRFQQQLKQELPQGH